MCDAHFTPGICISCNQVHALSTSFENADWPWHVSSLDWVSEAGANMVLISQRLVQIFTPTFVELTGIHGQ